MNQWGDYPIYERCPHRNERRLASVLSSCRADAMGMDPGDDIDEVSSASRTEIDHKRTL
jgi:hypothetical protein